ncbi:NTE family protein [Sedimentibacter acidaminivorans]|uniref:NTE family protein n=1 Tax=Sedimentibacter acidaminivorans TaxID=913099 RepID=A0ABS4GAX1_9FIRM|nr:patatin-like phospholipase family protein [Sedimentibacter acidaminivorans]MBP1924827.1 NTE family protein [Sedimentibacter acidaminivorans]
MTSTKRIGIALEGGGAKGAYQLGALKAIKELDIKYDCVVGTSIGALNAAAYVLEEYEKYSNLWKDMNFSFDISNEKSSMVKILDFEEIKNDINEFEKQYLVSKGIETDEIIQLYKKHIDEGEIRKSKINFGLSTYCLTDKKLLNLFIDEIPKGMLHEYIFASCCLPVFSPREINGKYYLDGSIYNRLPINMLVDKGYKKIITVRLRRESYDFSLYNEVNIIDIAPDKFLSNTLKANSERIKWMIDKGYEDAYRILNENLSCLI